mmetsp:Transcript_8339/g.22217  ORF Transcript_8339/g.22217 Transcript_8339/m.22217 type:complete len:99 (-) Transcript_8339:528-824(-)
MAVHLIVTGSGAMLLVVRLQLTYLDGEDLQKANLWRLKTQKKKVKERTNKKTTIIATFQKNDALTERDSSLAFQKREREIRRTRSRAACAQRACVPAS